MIHRVMNLFSYLPAKSGINRVYLVLWLLCFASGQQLFALTIVPTFDSTITGDSQAATIEATINSAIAVYQATYSDAVTVKITFVETNTGLGFSSTFGGTVSYSSYRSALLSHATTIDDATAVGFLPNTSANPVNGNTSVNIAYSLARALGLTSTAPNADGVIFLNTPICNLSPAETNTNKYSLFAVTCHEIDEVLGSSSALNNLTNYAPIPFGPIRPEDLFRYDENGNRSFTTVPNVVEYFSLDGTTALARFNQIQGGDFSDWYSSGGQTPQVQDAFSTPGATPFPNVELRVLDVLGYARQPSPVWVDFNFTGTTDGKYATPYKTLAAGVTAVNPSGTITIKAGNSGEAMTITKAMTLIAYGGNANIGLAHPFAAMAKTSITDSAPAAQNTDSGAIGEIQVFTGTANPAQPNK
jgi:hypothetical protein